MDKQIHYEYSSIAQRTERKHGRSWQFWREKRYIVALLAMFGYLCSDALRSNWSVAIVDMTQLKNVTLKNGTIVSQKEFDWDTRVQGYIFSSFYYGYIVTQSLGGYLANRFGGARIFGIGIASTGVFTVITPWVANTNPYFLIALRTMEGLFEGVTYPSVLDIWAKWAPPLEKTLLATIGLCGGTLGNIVAMTVSSLLATNYGWKSIFYVFGTFSLIWYLVWSIVVRDSPQKDSRISPRELKYITESIQLVTTHDKLAVPWKSLLSSKAVWAIAVTLFCKTWGWYVISTFLPRMMNSVLGFNLNKSGFLAALPFVAMTISNLTAGQLADWLIIKKYLTTIQVRRLIICVGLLGHATFLLAALFWISPVATPIFMVAGAAFGGISFASIMVNALDIAPNFASVIYGICSTIGTLSGVISPILTGYIVRDQWQESSFVIENIFSSTRKLATFIDLSSVYYGATVALLLAERLYATKTKTDVHQWRIIFYITAALYAFGSLVSILFMSGEIQPWAVPPKQGKEDETELEIITQDFKKESC